jgi:hypothetical protein
VTSKHYISSPITNKLCSLNCWYDSLMYTENPVPSWWSSYPSVPPLSHLTCTPTIYTIHHPLIPWPYLMWPWPIQILCILCVKFQVPFKIICTVPKDISSWGLFEQFKTSKVFTVRGSPSHPTSKPEDHPLSATWDYLFNIFSGTFHIWKTFPSCTTW